MLHHEKEGEQEDMSIPRQDNPIPTSLFFNKITCSYTFTNIPICPQIAPPVPTNNKGVRMGLSMIS